MLLLTSLCELPSIKMTGYVRVMHAWIDVSVEVPLISASAVPPEQEQKQEPKARRRGEKKDEGGNVESWKGPTFADAVEGSVLTKTTSHPGDPYQLTPDSAALIPHPGRPPSPLPIPPSPLCTHMGIFLNQEQTAFFPCCTLSEAARRKVTVRLYYFNPNFEA